MATRFWCAGMLAAALVTACSSFDGSEPSGDAGGDAGAGGGGEAGPDADAGDLLRGRTEEAQVVCSDGDGGAVQCEPLEACCRGADASSCVSGSVDACPKSSVVAFECDDPSDCAAEQRCCRSKRAGTGAQIQTCRPCDQAGELPVCGSDEDCRPGEKCDTSQAACVK